MPFIVLSPLMLNDVLHRPDPDHAIEIEARHVDELIADGIVAVAPERHVAVIGAGDSLALAAATTIAPQVFQAGSEENAAQSVVVTGEGAEPPGDVLRLDGGEQPDQAPDAIGAQALGDTGAVSGDETGAGNPAGPAPLPEFDGVDASLATAIDGLDPHNDALWTKGGAPDATVLTELLGRHVGAAERTRAWSAIRAHREG